MAKNRMIYETLQDIKGMQKVEKKDGFMTLSGCFGVCGVRNNNQRVYETNNYSAMVTEMKKRIDAEGGIPGELEHPQSMNITLENVSHKITDINIDENGMVTGTITLLNTPKGQIAQAIVEGGLPLFISSRATGQVDRNNGHVTLEKIQTYDLVGSPGFSQAKLHLNEGQIAESLGDSIYFIDEKENTNINEEEMDNKEIMEKLEALENRIQELEKANEELQSQVEEARGLDMKKLCDGIQKWVVEEYSPEIQKWIVEQYSAEVEKWINEEFRQDVLEEAQDNYKEHMLESVAPKIQNWIVEQFSPEIEKWFINEAAPAIQSWMIEEYAPATQDWLAENFKPEMMGEVENKITESKANKLDNIGKILTVLESTQPQKPIFPGRNMIVEGQENEPKFIQMMPEDSRVKWNMASDDVKESIMRRAKICNLVDEAAIARFWSNVDFTEIKPSKTIYEGLQSIPDQNERSMRSMIRKWHNK